MFWKREKKIINGPVGLVYVPPIPARKEFIEMYELLRDAERYDNEGMKDSGAKILSILKNKIELFISKKTKQDEIQVEKSNSL